MSKHEAKERKTVAGSPGNDEEELASLKETSGETQANASGKTNKNDKPGHDPESASGNHPEVTEAGFGEQIAELNEKYLRLYSEFDNYRKRTLKEKIELSKTASSEIISKLLPVLDDFERAIKALDATSDSTLAIKEGILLIFNKFITILNQQGLEQMRTIGEKFDTDFHEAITNIPAPSPDKKNTILDEVEKGYLLNGKVIRYAKVVVGN